MLKKLPIFILIMLCLILSTISYADVPSVVISTPTSVSDYRVYLNETISNVNDSLYWDGHAYSNLISQWTNDAGYLDEETDPIYSAWDKSTGIEITESQITDLGSYLTSESDTNYFTNPLGYYNSSTLPAGSYVDDWINDTIDDKIGVANSSMKDYVLWVNGTNGVGGEGSYVDGWINDTLDAYYVPYTGANDDLDLNYNKLYAGSIYSIRDEEWVGYFQLDTHADNTFGHNISFIQIVEWAPALNTIIMGLDNQNGTVNNYIASNNDLKITTSGSNFNSYQNITAKLFKGNGSQLKDVNYTETDSNYFTNPLGYYNSSTLPEGNYDDSWINDTIDDKITVANSSIKDYVDNSGFLTAETDSIALGVINGNASAWLLDSCVNASYLTVETDSIALGKIATMPNITLAQVSANIGNWTADKSSYTLLTYTNSIGNWSKDKSTLPNLTLAQINTNMGNWSKDKSGLNNLSYVQITAAYGNWSLDKPSYSTLAYVNTLGNWSKDKSTLPNLTLAQISANIGNFSAWDKTTGITILESQITDLGSYLESETDSNYFTNPLGYYNSSTLPEGNYVDDWINGTIDSKITVANSSMKDYVDNAGFLTEYTEEDTLALGVITTMPNLTLAQIGANIGNFSAWDKSTGITILESQITDLGSYLESETDSNYFTNPLGYYNSSTLPEGNYVDDWINDTIDSKIGVANDSMKDYIDNAGFLTGYIEEDTLALGVITTMPNLTLAQIGANIGNFSAWDKTTGITILESQITDLGTYLESESDTNYFTNPLGYYNVSTLPADDDSAYMKKIADSDLNMTTYNITASNCVIIKGATSVLEVC